MSHLLAMSHSFVVWCPADQAVNLQHFDECSVAHVAPTADSFIPNQLDSYLNPLVFCYKLNIIK
jgi:hypothetical protein